MAVERIVIHEGGTPWWVPLAVALGTALVAALASYAATWRFKKRDVDRDNAFSARDLIDEAELIVSNRKRWDAEGGAQTVRLLLQRARIRAEPLGSAELDDRFQAAVWFLLEWGDWHPHPEPVGAFRWAQNAVVNVREGLVPHLEAPRFLTSVRRVKLTPSFPTYDELRKMPSAIYGQELMNQLTAWKKARG